MEKNHVDALAVRHAAIEARLDDESHRPQPDIMLVNRLKKEKLKLKDDMVGH